MAQREGKAPVRRNSQRLRTSAPAKEGNHLPKKATGEAPYACLRREEHVGDALDADALELDGADDAALERGAALAST